MKNNFSIVLARLIRDRGAGRECVRRIPAAQKQVEKRKQREALRNEPLCTRSKPTQQPTSRDPLA
jgi:hypothetical protein